MEPRFFCNPVKQTRKDISTLMLPVIFHWFQIQCSCQTHFRLQHCIFESLRLFDPIHIIVIILMVISVYFRYFCQNSFRGISRVNMRQKRWRSNMNAGIHQKSICLTEPLCLHNIGPTTSWTMHCKLSHATRTSVWVIEYQLWPIIDNSWSSHIIWIHTMVISLDVLRWFFYYIYHGKSPWNHHVGNIFHFFHPVQPPNKQMRWAFQIWLPPVRWRKAKKKQRLLADFWANSAPEFQRKRWQREMRESDNSGGGQSWSRSKMCCNDSLDEVSESFMLIGNLGIAWAWFDTYQLCFRYLNAITFAQKPVLRQSRADLRKKNGCLHRIPSHHATRTLVKLHVLVNMCRCHTMSICTNSLRFIPH